MKVFGFKIRKNKTKTPTQIKKAPHISKGGMNEEEQVGVIVYRAAGRMKRKYGI